MPGKDIPPIRWGTFYDRQGNPHIGPAINEYLMEGHVLKETCFCGPKTTLSPIAKIRIIIHNVVH